MSLEFGFSLGLLLLKWDSSFIQTLNLLENTLVKNDILTLLLIASSTNADHIENSMTTVYGKAAEEWKDGEILQATKTLHDHLNSNPLDLLAFQICRTGYYYMGMTIGFHKDLPSFGFLVGIIGFIYNQMDDDRAFEKCKCAEQSRARRPSIAHLH
jgi:hypothetical protein